MAAGLILEAAAAGASVVGQIIAGDRAKTAAAVTASTIGETAELNAQLIEQGSELNAQVHDFNAAALELQATDAINQAKQQEAVFRQQLRGAIATMRTNYAAQGVEVSSGSAEQVQESSAYQGELDAQQIRVNAARVAWGYQVESRSERLQAGATRKLGTLQATNTRTVGKANANAARITGQNTATAANWGAATTVLTTAGNIYNKVKNG